MPDSNYTMGKKKWKYSVECTVEEVWYFMKADCDKQKMGIVNPGEISLKKRIVNNQMMEIK